MTGASFHLTRLGLAQLRKFEALELAALSPGLNIIAGPNGAGKSTLARALRAAFLDRHGSSSAADLQPEGHSGASPTVELDFVLDGVPHSLRKTFLRKKRCDLSVGGSLRSEQDAEDYLAQRLGFGFGKRGNSGSRGEHWGVPGLLWVEQGSGLAQLDAQVHHAGQHLGAALHAQAGEAAAEPGASSAAALAATAGDALIAGFEKSLEALLSKTVRKPTGAYAALLERLQGQREQLQAQQRRVAEYRGQVDELEQLAQAEHQDAARQPARQWQAELEQAQVQLTELQALQRRHAQAQEQAAQLGHTQAALTRELQQHGLQQRRLQERAQAMAQAAQEHAQAGDALQLAQRQHEAVRCRANEAQAAWLAVQQARERAALEERAQQAAHQLQRLQAQADGAQQQYRKLQQLTQELSALRIEKADIKRLKALEEAALKARLQRDAMATLARFELPPGQSLPWLATGRQGRWDGSGQQWLDGETRVELPGGGHLQILPGGHDVAGVAQRHERAQAELAQALRGLQLASRAEAESLWEQRQALEGQCALARQLLSAQAPQGLDELLLELGRQQAQLAALRAQCDALPASGAAPPDWSAAQAALQAAQQLLQRAQAHEQAANQGLAVAAQQWRSAQAEHAAAQQQLDDAQARARVQQAQQQLVSCEAALAQLRRQLQHDEGALQAPALRFAAQDVERLQASLQAHARLAQQRTLRMAELRAALEAAGAQGLEEASAALAGEIAHGERQAQAMRRRAEALAMLVDRLKAGRSAALRRLQAPLERRMRHYLQLLQPGAGVALDEALLPRLIDAGEMAGGAAQPLAGAVQLLSHGTQEQLAILSRLAYADLLRDAGQPVLLMFDDVLTFSDAQRLARMKRAIYDAATRHQVLLLTCHPEHWQDMGVAVRML